MIVINPEAKKNLTYSLCDRLIILILTLFFVRITIEELEEQLKASQAETAAAKEQISALTQQLATSVPRAEAMVARRDLEKRIEMLTKYDWRGTRVHK